MNILLSDKPEENIGFRIAKSALCSRLFRFVGRGYEREYKLYLLYSGSRVSAIHGALCKDAVIKYRTTGHIPAGFSASS
jgi:hypothetical protein